MEGNNQYGDIYNNDSSSGSSYDNGASADAGQANYGQSESGAKTDGYQYGGNSGWNNGQGNPNQYGNSQNNNAQNDVYGNSQGNGGYHYGSSGSWNSNSSWNDGTYNGGNGGNNGSWNNGGNGGNNGSWNNGGNYEGGPGFESNGNSPKKRGPGRIIAAVAGIALIGLVVIGAAMSMDKIGRSSAAVGQDSVLQAESQTDEAAPKATLPSIPESNAEAPAALPVSPAPSEAASPQTGTQSAIVETSEKMIESSVIKSSGLADPNVQDATSVVEHDMPAIVSITSKVVYQNFSQFGYNPFGSGGTYYATGSGSGVIIGDDGSDILIVTNNHVVADSESLTVTFCNETTAEAVIKGTSADNDLAVVAVPLSSLDDGTKDIIRAIEIGDSNNLVLGQRVIAIGNALGLGQSVTTGVISATSRELTTDEGTTLHLLQTDAAINPGNSGGALLDANGRLIGINVAKSGISGSEGVGFAIPITGAREIITELMNKQVRQKVDESLYPYLGVKLQDISSTTAMMYNMPVGIMVYSLEPDSPAEKAGIMKNDIITKFDGETVSAYSDLSSLLPYYAGGTTVDITVKRFENGEYKELTLSVTLGLRSEYATATR